MGSILYVHSGYHIEKGLIRQTANQAKLNIYRCNCKSGVLRFRCQAVGISLAEVLFFYFGVVRVNYIVIFLGSVTRCTGIMPGIFSSCTLSLLGVELLSKLV